jgi:hypothetical protein
MVTANPIRTVNLTTILVKTVQTVTHIRSVFLNFKHLAQSKKYSSQLVTLEFVTTVIVTTVTTVRNNTIPIANKNDSNTGEPTVINITQMGFR